MPSPWRDSVERDAWVERNCRVCFQPDEARKRITGSGEGCPLLKQADRGELPAAWERRRNPALGETYKCDQFLKQPQTVARNENRGFIDLPLFDLEDFK